MRSSSHVPHLAFIRAVSSQESCSQRRDKLSPFLANQASGERRREARSRSGSSARIAGVLIYESRTRKASVIAGIVRTAGRWNHLSKLGEGAFAFKLSGSWSWVSGASSFQASLKSQQMGYNLILPYQQDPELPHCTSQLFSQRAGLTKSHSLEA